MTEMLQTEPEENINDIITIIQTIVKKDKSNKTIPRQKPELRELIDPLLAWINHAASSQEKLSLFKDL